MVFEIKSYVKRMDEMYKKNFEEVKDELAEIKSLFKKEVSDVFKNIKRII
jgi:esterase/lipase